MNDRSPQASFDLDTTPEIAAVIPLVLAAWNDGVLSDEELAALRRAVDASEWLTPATTDALGPWLDPVSPPSPTALGEARRTLREADLPERDLTSLTRLGLSWWERVGEEGPWHDADAVAWLQGLESSLGVVGPEAVQRLLGRPGPTDPVVRRSPDIDPASLHHFLDREQRARRSEVMGLLSRPELRVDPTLPYGEFREQVLAAVRFLADQGLGGLAFPREHGGAADPAGAIAVFETLGFGDLSVLVKFGVQFGLFGGSIHQLGTERHHRAWLGDVASLALPGCYAMTETGHGSNVRDLETTATFDADGRQLVVHTPNEEAGKDWIGNVAAHGRVATVFARLVVGDDDHGVHAIVVPIRGEDGRPMPGVRIEDRGLKLGLNGVDNGRLWFDQVRVPVDNLLDRFASIDEDGLYQSPIPSAGRRFFTMLGTLVAGRVSVASAAVSASKTGLAIAVRYTADRRQFGPDRSPERPVLDYLAMQRSLAPRLATTYGLHFAVRSLQARFARTAGQSDPEVEVLAAGLKAYASDHCVDTLQACREACGGQGYLFANRFATLKADTDIFTTFEGANFVLLQLVAKGLLSRYQEEFGDLTPWRLVRYLGERAESTLTELNPVVTRRVDDVHLLDPDFHLAALSYREERLLRSAAGRMRGRLRDGVDSFVAVNEIQDHLLTLARAHVERVVLEAFQDGCATAPSPGMSELLYEVCALYGLSRIEAHRGWFLEAGYLEAVKSRAIRTRVNDLCGSVSDAADVLVSGFGIPEPLMPLIASG